MKTYIQPETSVIRIEPRNPLLNISIYEKELDSTYPENYGLVKENRSSRGISNYNVWDDDWSN